MVGYLYIWKAKFTNSATVVKLHVNFHGKKLPVGSLGEHMLTCPVKPILHGANVPANPRLQCSLCSKTIYSCC